ncbi:Phosphate transporter PHO1-1 [Dichanthelium oligosanthes]|uniref:Phosphate transporter PHO1-1 n=1 Tax=Dichanthelium oligosanthes TaxID=888268 RepID=A0A1E5W0E2_9POAL|nr:Phosphate transporter PHO1-1 [Dichanthelium oligosanthes]
MVKFSRQFEGQLVPEWKHAFVDYCLLKKDLKRVQHALLLAAGRCEAGTQQTADGHAERAPLSQWLFHSLPAGLFGSNAPPKDHGVIHVHRKLMMAGSASSRGGGGDVYETELLGPAAGGDDDAAAVREFFARLDAQLNKVNQFYKGKEEEFLERGQSLRKQMDILADLKAAAREREDSNPSVSSSVNSGGCSEDESSTRYAMTSAVEPDQLNEQETTTPTKDPGGTAQEDQQQDREGSGTFGRPAPVPEPTSLGRSVSGCGRKSLKINIPLTNPSRTIAALTDILLDELARQSSSRKCNPDGSVGKQGVVNKTKLRHAEKMIRGAFVELYKGLGYLATYRNLNMMAFVKILKKFEKISGKQVLSVYLKALKLMDEVEDIFVRHFAGDDRRKAMKYLKPAQRKESHGVSFFTGLMTGCFAALFLGYCVMAHMAGLYLYAPAPRRGRGTGGGDSVHYMETAYPVLSMFALLFLHLFLYGCNMVAWRRCRVNYGFIFESSPAAGGELRPRDVFLACAASMAAVTGVMFAHLALVLRGYHASPHVQAIPRFLLLVFLLLLFCPLNVAYRSSRFQFLRILRNIILSPLYKVVMVDFFMADQLCSQVPMLRSLEYLACYYISGSYTTQDYGYCINNKHIRDLAYAVSFLPYYWRAMQCARRWFDEGDTSHLVNLGKYVSAMLAAGAKVAYEKDETLASLSLLVAVSSTATVYQLYWDFVKDWGLLQANSKNPWLRNDLILKRKSIYYFSMGLNLVLRLAWLQTVIHPNFGSLDSRVTSFFLAALEVIRRGHWNFYRLENEHLNNAGKFRAIKTVPLPFHEVDED